LKRYQTVESRAVSKSQIDLAVSQAQSSTAQVDVARSKVQRPKRKRTLAKSSIDTATADVAQTRPFCTGGTRPFIYQTHRPEDGRVTRRTVGRVTTSRLGQSLLAIVPHNVWITANFKETQLAHMRPGQPVSIRVDAFRN